MWEHLGLEGSPVTKPEGLVLSGSQQKGQRVSG